MADRDVGAAARKAVCRMVKARARSYARRPAALEMLHPGLSNAAPATLVAIAQHLVERERRSPRRWFGFGGEIGLLNARAALLLGRAGRRSESRQGAVPDALRPEPPPGARVCRASPAKGPGTL